MNEAESRAGSRPIDAQAATAWRVTARYLVAMGTSVVFVGAQPDRVFERDALRAIMRWKFQPLTEASRSSGARQIIEFTLDPST